MERRFAVRRPTAFDAQAACFWSFFTPFRSFGLKLSLGMALESVRLPQVALPGSIKKGCPLLVERL